MNTDITYERDAINSYLVIKADNATHIENYEVEMLERNSIDSFLDLNIRTLNTEKKLYYNITSKQKLTEVLERKKLTYSELNNFFANLIGIIKNCEKYYLNSNKILLEPDMIYINPNGFLPCYVYTPLDNCQRDILEDTKIIIEFFFDKVSQEDVNAVMMIHRLITACKQHDFNINTIENIINSSTSPKVQSDNKIQMEQDDKSNNSVDKSNEEDNFIISKLIEQNKQREKIEESKHKSENIKISQNKKEEMTTKNKSIKNGIKPKQNKKNDNQKSATDKRNYMHFIIIGCIQILTVLIFLIMLKSKILHSDVTGEIEMASLLACIGMLLAVNLYSSKKAYDYIKNKEGKNSSINMNKKKVYNEPSVNSFNVEYKNRAKLFEEPIPKKEKLVRENNNTIEKKSYKVRQKMVTKQESIDYSSEDTILLEDYKQKLNIEAEPYLLSKDGDIVNKVIISNNPFIIGKLDSQVDYIIENSSVSRMHCKIIEEDGQYYIIDLNSKNGTYLDKERLVSNKRYQLHDGTHVAISNCEYTFEIN
ncbi:DUF6382 domain-containing protein [Vallitalea sp.]|jgi:hypothetical protein|uniref:DUF6382 domain-containing protein n=1 Tax=Vallitalea sp. TaxID=1882829 RepID=UPI0025EFCF21|nr:DUF6382 domain-containing protein [Vallitalea sp.]MCT4688710.1 FHA domain-containing protein [Vallitalea sp.]